MIKQSPFNLNLENAIKTGYFGKTIKIKTKDGCLYFQEQFLNYNKFVKEKISKSGEWNLTNYEESIVKTFLMEILGEGRTREREHKEEDFLQMMEISKEYQFSNLLKSLVNRFFVLYVANLHSKKRPVKNDILEKFYSFIFQNGELIEETNFQYFIKLLKWKKEKRELKNVGMEFIFTKMLEQEEEINELKKNKRISRNTNDLSDTELFLYGTQGIGNEETENGSSIGTDESIEVSDDEEDDIIIIDDSDSDKDEKQEEKQEPKTKNLKKGNDALIDKETVEIYKNDSRRFRNARIMDFLNNNKEKRPKNLVDVCPVCTKFFYTKSTGAESVELCTNCQITILRNGRIQKAHNPIIFYADEDKYLTKNFKYKYNKKKKEQKKNKKKRKRVFLSRILSTIN